MDINYSDMSAGLTPEQQAIAETARLEAERAKLAARIESLEADYALILRGKEAAERALAYERERALELAQNSNFSLKRDWVALVNELKQIKGETISEDAKENSDYQDALVIDFVNRLRIGALAELDTKDDETLYVIAKSYEVWYKACTAVLANRAIKIKVGKTQEFERDKERLKKEEKDRKVAKEAEKLDKRRRTPEEKMIESLMTLGMTEDQAREHVKAALLAGKAVSEQKQ